MTYRPSFFSFLPTYMYTKQSISDMLFHDDWELNLRDVGKLGVKGVHTPSGTYISVADGLLSPPPPHLLTHTHTDTYTGLNLRRWQQGLESFERERLQEMESERR